MTYATQIKDPVRDDTIAATLLDALCSPQLYEIVMSDGEISIKPRRDMHAQPAWQAAA